MKEGNRRVIVGDMMVEAEVVVIQLLAGRRPQEKKSRGTLESRKGNRFSPTVFRRNIALLIH